METMFVGLHGELKLHPWYDPDATDADPYMLFRTRSSMLSWLAGARKGEMGAWGMNDAGYSYGVGFEPPCVAWFQVVLVDQVPTGRPLPTQQFLSVVSDVVRRIGTLELNAVQLMMPVQCLTPAVTPTDPDFLLALRWDAAWLANPAPGSRTMVRATIDAGDSAEFRVNAPALFDWLASCSRDVFDCCSIGLEEEAHLVLRPPFSDSQWPSKTQSRVTVGGTLCEWSFDSIAWLSGLLSAGCFEQGVLRPITVSIDRLPIADAGPRPSSL